MGGHYNQTTNNKMELEALYQTFLYLSEIQLSNYEIIVRTDSQYVLNGLTNWIFTWQKNSWKTTNKKEVKNKEYWQKIIHLQNFLQTDNKISLEHIKAHNGEKYNERVDDIARGFASGKVPKLFDGNKKQYNI